MLGFNSEATVAVKLRLLVWNSVRLTNTLLELMQAFSRIPDYYTWHYQLVYSVAC